jgi:hypothetical protein
MEMESKLLPAPASACPSFSHSCNSKVRVAHSLRIFCGCCAAVALDRAHSFAALQSAIHTRMVSALNHFLNSISERFLAILAQIEDFEFFKMVTSLRIFDWAKANLLCGISGQVQVQVQVRMAIGMGVGVFERHSSILTPEFFSFEIYPNDRLSLISFSQMFILRSDLTLAVSVEFLRERAAALSRTTVDLKFLKHQIISLAIPVCRSDFVLFVRYLFHEIEYYLITVVAKELDEHNTGFEQFVLSGPIHEIRFRMGCVSRQPRPESAMIGKIGKVLELREVGSTDFKLAKSFLWCFLGQKESIGNFIGSHRFDSLFAVSDSLNEIKTTANQDCERKDCLLDEGILSFDDLFCQFFVMFLASGFVNLPLLLWFLNVRILEQISSTFESSQTRLEALCILKFDSNCFLKNKVMLGIFLSNCIEMMNHSANYDIHSNDGNTIFEDSDYSIDIDIDIEANKKFEHKVHDKEIELREAKCEKDGEDGAHSLRTEVKQIREFLRASGGSRSEKNCTFVPSESARLIQIGRDVRVIPMNRFKGLEQLTRIDFSSDSQVKEINGFRNCTSLRRIEFPSSLEIIRKYGFSGCTSLTEIVFPSDGYLIAIDGFTKCTSLCRIEFPSSLERIGRDGFYECTSLTEIIFSSDSQVKEINGFGKCRLLCQIELPPSLQIVSGFFKCTRLRIIIIHAGCRLKVNSGIRNIRPFIVHEDHNVKHSRRLIHLGISDSKA